MYELLEPLKASTLKSASTRTSRQLTSPATASSVSLGPSSLWLNTLLLVSASSVRAQVPPARFQRDTSSDSKSSRNSSVPLGNCGPGAALPPCPALPALPALPTPLPPCAPLPGDPPGLEPALPALPEPAAAPPPEPPLGNG